MPPYPFTPGFEASGVVVEAGHAVRSVRRGDAVLCVLGEHLGGNSETIICSEDRIFPKPPSLSFEEASALPITAVTMIAAFRKAQLKPSERILIQTAAGGTGLIAVQLAQHAGAEIYATAGSREKLDYLSNLGVPHLINYRECDFEGEIRRLTGGRGVDAVINTLAGDAIQKGMRCLAPGGRYIEIAMTALKSAKTIDLSVLDDNQTFYSIDLRKLGFQDPQVMESYRNEMLELVAQKTIRPTIHEVFPFEQIRAAYACLENRRNIGKVVIRVHPQTESTPVTKSARHSSRGRVSSRGPIAVIGMSGRFARSPALGDLWEHISTGTDLVEEVSRWDLSRVFAGTAQEDNGYCRHGSFVADFDRFDPVFFNISGLEALAMDPQQRLFLEESWKALEDAGYAGGDMQERRCGVYVGCSGGDYHELLGDDPPAQAFWGNASSVIPARIAYYLNLHGPAIAIDTACSSSLVALHVASQGLWTGETDMALAGGVFIQSTPSFFIASNRAGMLSKTGRCFSFDSRADGFVPGEGVGAVVLKRLDDALADGDHIHGVIRGSGINQDGHTNGITAPSARSQERLIRDVHESFGINAEDIKMVEAHGTGTELGDPIEVSALVKAFQRKNSENGQACCALGSIKSNLGHAATAAGIAGFFKVLLSLKHRKIPPSINYEAGNPRISLEHSPFFVNTKLLDWPAEPGLPRRAAISSFGFSGTNAHLIVEEPPATECRHAEKPGYLIVLSARSSAQLRLQVARLVEHVERDLYVDLGNLSYTLLVGRKHLNHRLACVVRSREEWLQVSGKWLRKGEASSVYVAELDDAEQREQPALKRFGNECISKCRGTDQAVEYLENLSALADLYIHGYGLAFEELFANEPHQRIPLPTHPFAKDRFWPDQQAAQHVRVDRALSQPAVTVAAPSEPHAKPTGITLSALSEAVPPPQAARVHRESLSIEMPGAGSPAPLHSASLKTLENELVDSFAKAMMMKPEQIDRKKKFIDMGLDSILSVEWIQALNKRYGFALTATRVYDYPTIRDLARFLVGEQAVEPAVEVPRIGSDSVEMLPGESSVLPRDYGLVLRNAQLLHEIALRPWNVPAPADDEITIQVRASAVNFPDAMCVKSLYPTMPEYPFARFRSRWRDYPGRRQCYVVARWR